MRGQRAILFRRLLAVAAAAATCALAGSLPALAGGGNGNGNGSGNGNGNGPAASQGAPAGGSGPGSPAQAPGQGTSKRSPSAGGRAPRSAPPAHARPQRSPAAPTRRGNGSGSGSSGGGRRASAPAAGGGSEPAGRSRSGTRAGSGSAAPAGGAPTGGGSGARGRGGDAGRTRTGGGEGRTSGGRAPERERTGSGERSKRGSDAGGRRTGSGSGSGGRDAAPAPGGGSAPQPPVAGVQGGGAESAGGGARRGGDALGRLVELVPLRELARSPRPAPALGLDARSQVVVATGEAFGVSATGAPVAVPVGPVGLASDGPLREAADPREAPTDFSADDGPGGPPVTRTVREIVEVVPGPVKAALVLLALLAAGLGLRAAVTGARARRLERQRRELLAEVGLLQTALLPEVPERLGELLSTVAYRPAEGPAAGGDFYDAFVFDGGRVGLVVGDVAGHGRDALARTALIRYTLRAYLDAGLEPRAALKVAGSVLDDDLGSDFATVAVAIFDPAAGTLTYAGAGHPPPILLGPAAHEPVTACSSPPVGAGATTGLRQTTVSLPAGSVACFFTDGLLEARVDGGLLGRERLVELLERLGPDATAEALLAAVVEAADAVPDDMAAIVLRPATGAAGKLRVEELEVAAPDLRGTGLERYLRACGVPMSDVPALTREAADTVARSGSAVLRVRLGDWRPGVDVLPGNVEVLVRTPRRVAGARTTS